MFTIAIEYVSCEKNEDKLFILHSDTVNHLPGKLAHQ